MFALKIKDRLGRMWSYVWRVGREVAPGYYSVELSAEELDADELRLTIYRSDKHKEQ